MNLLSSLIEYTYTSFVPEERPRANSAFLPQGSVKFLKIEMMRLPENFADELMQLQMQIQSVGQCDANLIRRLNQLYMTAIQYYSQAGVSDERKVEHFMKKTRTLFSNIHVIKTIQAQKKQNERKSYKNQLLNDIETVKNLAKFDQKQNININQNINRQQQKIHAKKIGVNPVLYQANLKQELSKFTSQSDDVVKTIMQQNQRKQQTKNKIISTDLENQQKVFQDRLEKRVGRTGNNINKKQKYRQLRTRTQGNCLESTNL